MVASTSLKRVALIVCLGLFLAAPQLTLARLHPAPSDRADLKIPDEIMEKVCANVGYKGRTLGFSADQMANFGGDKFRLRLVNNLFRDITALPRTSGVISDRLLANADTFDIGLFRCFTYLDIWAGYGIAAPTETTWAVSWLPDSANVDEALEALLARDKGPKSRISTKDRQEWNKLPEGVKRLVTRLAVAEVEATPELRQAYDDSFLAQSLGVSDLDKLSRTKLYEFSAVPFIDTIVNVPRASFEEFDHFDLNFLALGSYHFFKFARAAIQEFQAWRDTTELDLADFNGCTFNTPAGLVRICGTKDDTISGDYSLLVDLGGNDSYVGATAVPRSFTNPISVVLDIAGDDTYDSGDEAAALACGNHGIGAIFDLAGDDTYKCRESGIASAWFGTGVVVDYQGDDSYSVEEIYGIAAAHAGVAMLFDLAGDDNYACQSESEAFGATLGVGLLFDAEGNDNYTAKGRPDAPWGDFPISLTMGIGIGRRADFGDGHSMAGGIGIAVDGAGDDNYQLYVFSFGSGYWWGMGMFEDCAGNDTYSGTFYSFGGAPHYALGCMVDRSGNDIYNIGRKEAGIGFGHGRDGSFGVFIDGDGDDQYFAGQLGQGGANLNSIGLFWDRRGNDLYTVPDSVAYDHSLVFGSGWKDADVSRSFRNGIPEVGIFLDTEGKDIYEQFKVGEHHKAKDNSLWRHFTGPRTWGFGWDTNWYEPAK